MKFSIITPSLNQGRYIRDCIESVRTQTGVEWEHLVMDGGSMDDTVEILKTYPHLQWVSERDAGQSDAINKGFRRARGDWLMWLNADDYLNPGALARVGEFISATPDADVVFGDCDYVRDGAVAWQRRERGFDYWMLMFYGCYIPSTATFLRRRIFDDGQWLDASLKVCMDYEFYLRLAGDGYLFNHLPLPVACFRWHDSNFSATHRDQERAERLQIRQRALSQRGLAWMAQPWLLRVLHRLYAGKRRLIEERKPAV